MTFGPVSPEEVRRKRAETGYGMATCRGLIERENVLRTVQLIREGRGSDAAVADILEWLVKSTRIG